MPRLTRCAIRVEPVGLPWIRQEMSILAGNDDPIIPMMNAHIKKFLLAPAPTSTIAV